MDNCSISIIQLNCQRVYGVLCDVERVLCERRVSVALLQEVYVSCGSVCGLPSSWRVFTCERASSRAAVVVNDAAIEAMCVNVFTNEHGVCVWLKGNFGELFVVSMYCRYGHDIEPYLAYMDRVRRYTKGKCVIFGMDANATSSLWLSKGGARSKENEMRRILEEWIVLNGTIVLNEPSELYTFSGIRG